jgi:vitamin B12 transporter
VQYSHYKTDLDNGAFTDDADFTNTNTNKLAGTRLQYKSEKLTLVAHYMYGENERSYLDDSTDVPGFVKYGTNDFFGKSQFAELYGNISLAKGLTLLAGGDFRYASMNSRYFSLSSFGPYETRFADTALHQGSLYASLLYAYKGLNLEGGIRWNRHQRYGSNATYTINPSYAFNDHWRAFASAASGFKAPSIYQLYSAYGNIDLQAEKSVNYEAGLQQTHKKITNRIVYFNRDINNGIDFDNRSYQYFNISRQQVQGLELESRIQAGKGISLSLNYTYLIPVEEVQSRLTFKDTSYSYLLRRPKHQLQANAGWQVTPALLVSLNGRYVSERYDVGGYQQPDARLDAYFLLGAYVEYKLRNKTRFFADLQNITNREFTDIRGFNGIPFLAHAGFNIPL